MNNLQSVQTYADGNRAVSFDLYKQSHYDQASFIEKEIDLIEKYLIEDQSVTTELKSIEIFSNSVCLQYSYPKWLQKLDADRLKSNLEKESSNIRSFELTKTHMKVRFRLKDSAESIEEDYRQLLKYAAPCMKKSDAVIGFKGDSDNLGIQFSDLSIDSPMMISGYPGSGKTELVISMLHSMMQHEKPRDLQFALIDQDVEEIVDRLDLKKSGYIEKFDHTAIRNRGKVHEILAAVVEEIDRRKFLSERFNKVVTYQGLIDQWCQIIVVIDDFELFQYSRYELMSLIRYIAAADRSLNVRLIMTTHDGRLSEFLGIHTVEEYFKELYDLNVKTLVRVDNDQSSHESRHIADLFNKDGFRRASVKTIKLSKEN